MAGAVAHLTAEDDAAIEKDMAWLAETAGHRETRVATDAVATTDKGRNIELREAKEVRSASELERLERRILFDIGRVNRQIQIAPANDTHNCHGWVFAGGKFWLAPESVELILEDNGYVPVSDPRVGDVVIYRSQRLITHTALVRAVTPGRPVLVEGKWGWMAVELHAVADSPYGANFTYYRSDREGHVVHGLGGKPSEAAPVVVDRLPTERIPD